LWHVAKFIDLKSLNFFLSDTGMSNLHTESFSDRRRGQKSSYSGSTLMQNLEFLAVFRIRITGSDPDPGCHFYVDSDPACHFGADPDPAPSFQIKTQNLEKVLQ
jgi:hypothetical protein